jgi:hypothetical protein
LLNNAALTHANLLTTHWQATRQAAPTPLLVQDASELNFTPREG